MRSWLKESAKCDTELLSQRLLLVKAFSNKSLTDSRGLLSSEESCSMVGGHTISSRLLTCEFISSLK